jgi:hypothetical protein
MEGSLVIQAQPLLKGTKLAFLATPSNVGSLRIALGDLFHRVDVLYRASMAMHHSTA